MGVQQVKLGVESMSGAYNQQPQIQRYGALRVRDAALKNKTTKLGEKYPPVIKRGNGQSPSYR